MAYQEYLNTIVGRVQLNNGTTTSGNVRTQNISIGTLNPNAWDLDKFGAITTAMHGIFSKAVYNLQNVKTYSVDNA